MASTSIVLITILLIATALALLVDFVTQRRPQGLALAKIAKPDLVRPKRYITLRITDVPTTKTREALKQDLAAIASVDSVLQGIIKTSRRVSLASVSNRWACATVSLYSSLSETELVTHLSQATATTLFGYQYDYTFDGITPLYEDEAGAQIDIIAVPGLASRGIGCWAAPDGNDVWLRDYLPDDVPGIRVLLYGYNTDILKSQSRKSIEDMGKSFLESVTAFRSTNQVQGTRPILLLGHSLGGLLIKEALIHASKSSRYDLAEACCGLLFFGVPNHGLRDVQLQALVQGQPNEAFIRDLLVDRDTEPSNFLKRITNQFAEAFRERFHVISFYEMKHSPTLVPSGNLSEPCVKILMVTETSATSIGITAAADEYKIGLDTDHSGLVKFSARSQDSYLIVVDKIKKMAVEGILNSHVRFADGLPAEAKHVWINLNDPPYDSFRKSRRLLKPYEGTLRWLIDKDSAQSDRSLSLHSRDFIPWRDSDKNGALLVTGSPGQGKSVLCNFIVSSLEAQTVTDTKVIYYFCNANIDASERNATSVLRSLIMQLCETRGDLFEILPSDFAKESRRFFTASVGTLLDIFERMLRIGSYGKVFCVIDGLDVYQDSMDDLIAALVRIFRTTSQNRGSIAKLICTSRPNQRVIRAWGDSQRRILRCNSHDLEIFVDSKIAFWETQFTHEDILNLKAQILEKGEHTFLWLDVMFKAIDRIGVLTLAKVRETIANSASDLSALYRQLADDTLRADNQYARVLAWLVYSKRPLHYTELAEAIAMEPNVRYLTYKQFLDHRPSLTVDWLHQTFGTLLDVVEDRIYPIHESVKSFFETEYSLRAYLGNMEAHLWPAHVSTTYLNLEVDETTPINRPFFQYSSEFWSHHITSANDVYDNPRLEASVLQLLNTTFGKVQAWTRYIQPGSSQMDNLTPKTLSKMAVGLNIDWLAQLLVEGKMNLGGTRRDSLARSTKQKGNGLQLLFKHGQVRHANIPKEVVLVVENLWMGAVRVLLKPIDNELATKQDVLQAAPENSIYGEEDITLLGGDKSKVVEVTKEPPRIATLKSGKEILGFLRNKRPDGVATTAEVVKVATRLRRNGKGPMSSLSDT